MSKPNSELTSLIGERGIPSVNSQRSFGWKRSILMPFLLGGLLATAGFSYWAYVKSVHKKSEQVPQKELQISKAVPARHFELMQQKQEKMLQEPSVPNGLVGNAQPQPVPDTKLNLLPMLDKSGSALMVSKEDNVPQTPQSSAATMESSGAGQGSLGGLLNSTPTPLHSASLLTDRNYLLAKGSFIDCVLQTKLDTTVPGMTSCVVTRTIYSDNGKVVLIERGSTVSGEYQATIKQGQARIFVLWNRIKTPSGVVINLDSPGTDSLSGSGLPGYVDNHFWQRFGGALLLSLVQDVAAGAANRVDPNSTTITFNNTSDASQSLAIEALRNTIHIPPTLYKNQGERIGIYVARDLDFKNVYELKLDV